MRTFRTICSGFILAALLAPPVDAQVNDRQTPGQGNVQGQTPNNDQTDSDGTRRSENAHGVGAPESGDPLFNSGTKDTTITFSGPVQLPDVTLPAGIYLFKTMPGANTDHLGDHVLQVSDRDGKKAYGTFLTIPNERFTPTDKTVILFAERPAGVPQAVKVWFYPGATIGEELVYPKNEAVALAKANHTTVLTSEGYIDENGELGKDGGQKDQSKGVSTTGSLTPQGIDRGKGEGR
jgi:hypothetical protein